MRDGQKIAIIAGAFTVVVSAIGFGAYAVLGGDDKETNAGSVAATSDSAPEPEETIETGPPTEEEVLQISADFLTAWAADDAATAAELTDDPEAAETALADFAERAQLAELALVEGTPEGASVPFTVESRISFQEQEADWSYESELTVVRDTETGDAVVAWEPTVLHPELTEGHSVETGTIGAAPPVKALDRNGDELSADDFPSLTGVLGQLPKRYAEHAGGTHGVETRIVDGEGEKTAQLLQLSKSTSGEVPTTIDPVIQRAAEQAVSNHKHAAVVAIQPSTGAILGLANAPAVDSFDTALNGSYAPGSTWKIVSAGMLIDNDLASSGKRHPCPKYFEHGGWKFQNLDKFEIRNGTFAQSFAASCNTAFVSQAPELSDSQLGGYAKETFGVGLEWQVGVSTADGAVPTQQNAQMAAQLIGQGAVRANPMVMASVAATVKDGTFRQPYLVPASFDGRQLTQTAGPSAATAQELRQLMNLTATSGSAAEAMAGLSGDIGGKTGSAEVMDQEKPNSWFTAYRNDLAVAALVPSSGHGGKFAGPVVADVLRAAP